MAAGTEITTVGNGHVATDVDLFEISLVTFPANEQARVSDVKTPTDAAERRILRAAASRLHRAAKRLAEKKKRVCLMKSEN